MTYQSDIESMVQLSENVVVRATKIPEMRRGLAWFRLFAESGLFAKRNFEQGALIGHFAGQTLPVEEYMKNPDLPSLVYCAWKTIDGQRMIRVPSNIMKYANSLPKGIANMHMCDDWAMVAVRDIKAGEELTWPYLSDHPKGPGDGISLD